MDNNKTSNIYTDPSVVSLRENVAEVMQHYFANLKGEEPRNVYDFFLDEIEEPLLAAVMKFTRDNQSEAARILGVSRGTLRAKLKKFGMLK
jgi:Fis family transcriptional regulator, factor for inversion stimulation protein